MGILFGKGISKISEIIDIGEKLGIIKKSGSWFSYGEDRIGQGKDNVRKFLETHADIADEIEKKVREAAKPELLDEEIENSFELDDDFDVREFELDE